MRLVGGSDPRIDIITERLGGFEAKWISNQNQMSLLFSRLSKTEKLKEEKNECGWTGMPNALYSQLIIFLHLTS